MKDIIKFFDKTTFTLMVLLSVVGIFCIYSAGHASNSSYYLRQLLWLFLSLLAFALVFSLKIENLFSHSLLLLLLLSGLLALQILLGHTVAGTKSWLRFGFFNIQVSEFVKVPLALYLARLLTQFDVIGWKTFARLLLTIGIPFGLIVLQPDLGVSFMFASFMLTALLLKRIRVVVLLLSLLLLVGGGFVGWKHFLKPYQRTRIIAFFNPQKYRVTSGYHVIQSKIAIGSGGLTGKGYLRGSQSQYQFLPTRHNDFIVAVIGEEFGFLWISLLFFLYFLFFYRQFRFKFLHDEEFYYVYLFNGLILFQFLVNVLVAIGLFPVLGITLPFVSYGGSSLLSLYMGEALIFRIKINNYLTA